MTLSLTKYISSRDIWMRRLLKIMSSAHLSKCSFFFIVRLGTKIIAIVDLALTSFILFLFILGATHLHDDASMAFSDLQDLKENNNLLLDDPMTLGEPIYYSNNERRMQNGQNLVSHMLLSVYITVFVTSIHFVTCLMLLYGALKNTSQYMLPWLSTVLMYLILGGFIFLMLAFLPYPEDKLEVCIGFLVILVEAFAWFIVFSFYRLLYRSKCSGDVENIVVINPVFETQKCVKTDI